MCSSTPVLILPSCFFPLSSFLPLDVLAKLFFGGHHQSPKGPQEVSNPLKAGPDSELYPKFWMCLWALCYNGGHRCESRLCSGQTTKIPTAVFQQYIPIHPNSFDFAGEFLILKELDSKIFKFRTKSLVSYFSYWLFHSFLPFCMLMICITFTWCLH